MKQYTLTITAAEWNGAGIDYVDIIEQTEPTSPEWDIAGMAEWINDGKDVEDLAHIIEHADVHDVKYTFTVSDENGNVAYDAEMWESQAALIAMEEVNS